MNFSLLIRSIVVGTSSMPGIFLGHASKDLPALQITEGLQHRREYECSNLTSQTLKTLCKMAISVNVSGVLLILGNSSRIFN